MKRYLVIILTLTLLLPCLIVPASATTQGVINAIDDLGGYIGIVGRDIVDWLETIWDSFCDLYSTMEFYLGANLDFIATQVADMMDTTFPGFNTALNEIRSRLTSMMETTFPGFNTALNDIHSRLTSIDSFFFTRQPRTFSVPIKITNTSGMTKWVVQSRLLSLTGFEYSLLSPVELFVDWFVDMANAIVGDTTTSDQFQEDMAPLETEVDDFLDQMETAPTINVDDIETEVDKVTDFETDASYLSILSGIFLNEAFLMMFTWCVILAMLGFILYGKR